MIVVVEWSLVEALQESLGLAGFWVLLYVLAVLMTLMTLMLLFVRIRTNSLHCEERG
jgi:hypothetical protein